MTFLSHVYFIQAGEHGPIKIGVATDPEHRRQMLQTGNSADLILRAAIPGSGHGALKLERKLHDRFAAGRMQGEWFRPDTPGLKTAIAKAVQVEAEAEILLSDILDVPPKDSGETQ